MAKSKWAFILFLNLWSVVGHTDSSGVPPVPRPESEPEPIVVTAPRRPTCDIDGIKRRLNRTLVQKKEGAPFAPLQIAEFNDLDGGGFSLSCEGEPNCRGHIFRVFGGEVKIENEPGGIAISIGGDIEHCKKKDEDQPSRCSLNRRLTRRSFVSFSDILNADGQGAHLTCEPGRCEAFLLDQYRNENGAYVHGAVLVIRKNKAGVETAQLIVNSSDAAVFAEDLLNERRHANKFKSCPTAPTPRNTERREGRESSSGAQ